MSGDFLAYLIHQNAGYCPVPESADSNNKYLFPNWAQEVYGWNNKVSNRGLQHSDNLNLTRHYQCENLVVPTHRFQSVFSDEFQFIRLYTHDIPTARISYAMWFLKAHSLLHEPWPERLLHIRDIQNPSERDELLSRWHKWKFLAWQERVLSEDGWDARYYVHNYFTRYYYIHNHLNSNHRRGYNYYDLGDLLYSANVSALEKQLNITIDRKLLQEYAERNRGMLHVHGIDIHSDDFFDQLADAVMDNMNLSMDINNL